MVGIFKIYLQAVAILCMTKKLNNVTLLGLTPKWHLESFQAGDHKHEDISEKYWYL